MTDAYSLYRNKIYSYIIRIDFDPKVPIRMSIDEFMLFAHLDESPIEIFVKTMDDLNLLASKRYKTPLIIISNNATDSILGRCTPKDLHLGMRHHCLFEVFNKFMDEYQKYNSMYYSDKSDILYTHGITKIGMICETNRSLLMNDGTVSSIYYNLLRHRSFFYSGTNNGSWLISSAQLKNFDYMPKMKKLKLSIKNLLCSDLDDGCSVKLASLIQNLTNVNTLTHIHLNEYPRSVTNSRILFNAAMCNTICHIHQIDIGLQFKSHTDAIMRNIVNSPVTHVYDHISVITLIWDDDIVRNELIINKYPNLIEIQYLVLSNENKNANIDILSRIEQIQDKYQKYLGYFDTHGIHVHFIIDQ
jgi:hypothetical protein